MFLAAFLGPSKMGSIDYVYDPIHAAAYNAFAPIGWCGLFLWMAITQHTASSNGNYWKSINNNKCKIGNFAKNKRLKITSYQSQDS